MKKSALLFICAVSVFFAASCSKSGGDVDPDPVIDIDIDEGTTVCGRIYYGTNKTPVKDVVVTDGVLFTKTDAKGIYQLKSKKKNSLVYITVPAFYTVKSLNTQPKFYQQLTKPADVPEQHDFVLTKDSGQTTHTRILFGDIHIYNSTSCAEFTKCASKINRELSSGVLKKPFGLTLGDMSWDWFWYANNYKILEYLDQINQIKGLQVFCTVGNHDHDMKYGGKWWNSKQELIDTGEDWTCEIPYRKLQGPTCYSCNIGNVHYVSMDDALTIDDGTGTKDGRGCECGFTEPDLEWLKNDMSFVPEDNTVVMTVHIPFTNKTGTFRTISTKTPVRTLANMLAPFAGRSGKFLVISAHNHAMHNYEDLEVPGSTVKLTEWNSPAVCGNFWASSAKGMDICADGTPGGYRILEFTGSDITCAKYVPTEHDAVDRKDFYPFRSYDVNNIKFSDETLYPADKTSEWYENFKQGAITSDYWFGNSENYVDIYVWDWKKGWKLEVKETLSDSSVKTLTPEQRGRVYDGLSLLALVRAKGGASEPGYNLSTFRVKASAPNTTLTITVKDPYGFSATEKMVRPKAFIWDDYKKELKNGYNK